MNIAYCETIPEALETLIEEAQTAYEAAGGITCNYTPFYFIAKEKETVLGVISGYTCYAEIYIDDLIVLEGQRKKGIGTALIKAVESKYSGEQFHNINLVTSKFQAPRFYEKCGFTLEFVRENKKNPLLTKYFYVKLLDF